MSNKKILFTLLVLSVLVMLSSCKKKSQSEKQEESRQEARAFLTPEKIKEIRNEGFRVVCGDDYKIDESSSSQKVWENGYRVYITFKGKVNCSINGKKDTYDYVWEQPFSVEYPNEKPDEFNGSRVINFSLSKSGKVVKRIMGDGREDDLSNQPEQSSESSSVSVSDDDISGIEDALQREWDLENSSSPVGAESSNVFNVQVDSKSGSKVTVTYSLRSTYNGEKKFVNMTGEVEKGSDGSWKVTNLGY